MLIIFFVARMQKLEVDYRAGTVYLQGELTLETLPQALFLQNEQVETIDAQGLTKLDTAGSLLIIQLLKAEVNSSNLHNLRFEEEDLLNLVKEQEAIKLLVVENKPTAQILKPKTRLSWLKPFEWIGRSTFYKFVQIAAFLKLIGELTVGFAKTIRHPKRFPLKNILSVIDTAGCGALPILGLLAFLIGVVLAYQIGVQLKNYGANIFIVRLTSIAIFREFGPLMAAVIIAGRSSSAFTAEIGTMKVNQEIDALKTMGISPVIRLIMPKFLGMLIIFPFLIFWSDILALIGSMVMARASLDISFMNFIQEFQRAVQVRQFWVGVSKAPVLAAIIALVGCHQGFLVKASPESVGRRTTKSVVQAIFLIIVADACFSVLYNILRL